MGPVGPCAPRAGTLERGCGQALPTTTAVGSHTERPAHRHASWWPCPALCDANASTWLFRRSDESWCNGTSRFSPNGACRRDESFTTCQEDCQACWAPIKSLRRPHRRNFCVVNCSLKILTSSLLDCLPTYRCCTLLIVSFSFHHCTVGFSERHITRRSLK